MPRALTIEEKDLMENISCLRRYWCVLAAIQHIVAAGRFRLRGRSKKWKDNRKRIHTSKSEANKQRERNTAQTTNSEECTHVDYYAQKLAWSLRPRNRIDELHD